MEHRQHVEELVARCEVDARGRLGGIGQHVPVAQDHALGLTFRTGGEHHYGDVIGGPLGERVHAGQAAGDLVGHADFLADIVQPDEFHLVADFLHQSVQLGLGDERAGGQYLGDFRRAAGGNHVARAGGEVDHRRNLARRHQGERRHHRPVGIGQHHADGFVVARNLGELAGQNGGAGQQFAIGQMTGNRILHGRFRQAAFLGRRDHLFDDGLVGRQAGLEDQVGHDLVELGAGGGTALSAFQLFRHGQFLRFHHGHLHFREQALADLVRVQVGERRLFQAVDADRHDLRAGLVGHHGGAVIDLHQAAGDGDPAFREDRHRLAGIHHLDQRAGRHRLGRVDRKRIGEPQERLDPGALGHVIVDREGWRLVGQGQCQRRVQVADVVQRQDRSLTGLFQVLQSLHLHAEKSPVDDGDQIAEGVGRQGLEHDDRGNAVQSGQDQHDVADAETDLLGTGQRNATCDHDGGTERIGAGNGAGTVFRLGPGLKGGEGRDNQHGAGNRKACHVDGDAHDAGLADEIRQRTGGGRYREAVEGEVNVEAEAGHQHGAEHGRQQHDAAGTEPGGDRRTDADGNGEDGQEEGDRGFPAAHDVLHDHRQHGYDDGADQPEPGAHQSDLEQAAVSDEIGQDVPGGLQHVPVGLQIRGCDACGRDLAADEVASDGKRQHDRSEGQGNPALREQQAGGNGAAQNGEEGTRLDPGVRPRQLFRLQVIGQDAVFHRAEQGGNRAEHEQGGKQDRDRLESHSGDREDGPADLGEFQLSGH